MCEPLAYLNLHQVHRLKKPGLSCELTGIKHSASCGNDLATTTVDCVSVQGHIMNIKTNPTHVLLAQDSLKSRTLL